MAKPKTDFVCQECGTHAPKWVGRCSGCGEYDTMVEERVIPDSALARPHFREEKPVEITRVSSEERSRMVTGIGELDRVLGGGIVHGSVNLLGGDPGIGKSTLLLQLSLQVAGEKVLYVSSEESVQQTRLRADRMGAVQEGIWLLSETDVQRIRQHAEELRPKLLVVDSIQMVHRAEIPSAPGSVAQVRECAADLTFFAKRNGLSLFIVGHVTKEGAIAGPRTLEHLVDGVFYFEGDRFQTFRILRGVKNRFGSTNEIGIFEMRGSGLVEVDNPSELFMSEDRKGRTGSVVSPCVIGSRTLLVEVQSLTAHAAQNFPSRRSTGVDAKRLPILIAVLMQHCGFDLSQEDVFVNAVGGVDVSEPAVDLAAAAAIASSYRNRSIDPRTCMVGEVGLAGEVRGVSLASGRLMEAARLGFERAVIPADNMKGLEIPEGIEVMPVRTLSEALETAAVI